MTATVFGGSGNPNLARSIADELGLPLGRCSIERHPDGEVRVVLHEPVRRRDVIVVQSTSPPVDAHLVELLALVDACRRAAADRIIAAVPYFGYGRSDRRRQRREPVMASLVARLLETAGVDHLVTVDLHAPQTEGFFRIPVDCLSAVPVLTAAFADRIGPDTVVVSPDMGRVAMAADVAGRLGLDTALIEKRREDGTATTVLGLIGDVRDRPCLIVDDILATGDTAARAIARLRSAGARPEVTIAVSHALLLRDAARRLTDAGVRLLVTSDTVEVATAPGLEMRIGSMSELLASALERLVGRPPEGARDLGGRTGLPARSVVHSTPPIPTNEIDR